MNTIHPSLRSVFAALCVLATSVSAVAGPIILAGNNPQTDENVLLNSGETGATVQGTLNQSGGVVYFSSLSGDLVSPSSGQARVEGATGNDPFNDLSFWLADDATFTSAIFNLIGDSGTIAISVDYDNGQTFLANFDTGNGSNFFTVLAGPGSVLNKISLGSLDGSFDDLRQVRIGGYAAQPPVVNVPDHGLTLVLVGASLVGLATFRRARG